MPRSALIQFLAEHLNANQSLHENDDQCPPWWEEGTTVQVEEQTYYDYLDLLPPRYMDGDLFAYGEGSGAFSIFWSQDGKFYVHHLTQAHTDKFCELAGLAQHA